MCTAITYKTKNFYFGRTLDYDESYQEEVVITPRKFPLQFREQEEIKCHYAIIGMAHVENNYPLYYDAINEEGLGIAALNFVGNAVYKDSVSGKDNITPYELIPWILSQCGSVKEASVLLDRINLTNKPFCDNLPLSQLHWIIADHYEAITLESVKDGVHIYKNPVGVLTNNPPFEMQMFQLNRYMQVSPKEPKNFFSKSLQLEAYSRGMGGLGLPGDLSSQSRFVRAAFTKLNAVSGNSEHESVSQFFHILGSVNQPRGCCDLGDGKYEITMYTSCCDADNGVYYYTTYDNHQITAVDMHKENLDGISLVRYPLILTEQIKMQN